MTPKCRYQAELSLETLVWTRGRNMPLAGIANRMMCPHCGNRRVNLIFEPPPVAGSAAWVGMEAEGRNRLRVRFTTARAALLARERPTLDSSANVLIESLQPRRNHAKPHEGED